MPPCPGEAAGALETWHLLNQVRDLPAVAAVILAQAGLSRFEVSLLATIEQAVKDAPRPVAPAEGE